MKMILIILLAINVLSPIRAQNTSSLYNKQGALIANPNYQINEEALEKWSKYEDFILWRVSSGFQFSDVARDEELNGSSLLKINILNTGKGEISKLIITGGGLEEIVILSFEKQGLYELLKPEISDSLIYYLPIEFKLDNIKTAVDTTGKLYLRNSYFPQIQK